MNDTIGPNVGFGEPFPPTHMDLLVDSLFRTCRTELNPEHAVEEIHEILRQFVGTPVKPLILLCGGSRIGTVSDGDLLLLVEHAWEAVRMLDIEVKAFGIGNEPDLAGISAAAYRDKAVLAGNALRYRGYAGPILAGEVSNLHSKGIGYLRKMEWSALKTLLTPSAHRYAPENDPDRYHFMGLATEYALAIDACAGLLPWITEMGYHTARIVKKFLGWTYSVKQLSDVQAAVALARDVKRFLERGAPAVYPFQWQDGAGTDFESRYGITHQGQVLKPQGQALKALLEELNGSTPVPAPPEPAPMPPSQPGVGLQVAITVWEKPGLIATPAAVALQLEDGNPPLPCARIDTGQWIVIMPPQGQYGHYGVVHVDGWTTREQIAANMNVTLPEKPSARPGVVRFNVKSWMDDAGQFYPLGDTMLYALGHWHRDGAKRELVKENAVYVKGFEHDYVRWLGDVGWADDQHIDPNWPDYARHAAELIDWLYEHGLRSKVTVTGGGFNARLAAQKLHDVIMGHQHKVILVEAVNELNASAGDAITITQMMADLGVPRSIGRGNSGLIAIKADGRLAMASVNILHTERGNGDPKDHGGVDSRRVRQCWDFKEFDLASEDGEGPGPTSSAQTLDDPFKLAVRRFANITCGAGAGILHTGSGVFGKDYQSSHGYRFARLRDQPQADRMMRGVKAADKHLPSGIENWSKFNGGYGGPLIVSVPANNVDKVYGCRALPKFVEVVIGVDGSPAEPVTLRAERGCDLKVVNPETAAVIFEGHLNQGDTLKVQGLWGYGIVGEVR